MQKAKKGNVVLAIGLTAALALGSAGLAGTAYADTPDQSNNRSEKILPWYYSYSVKIYNVDKSKTEKTYTINVKAQNSIKEAVKASLDNNIPEGTQFTGSMGWELELPWDDFDSAVASYQNKCRTIVVKVENTVVPAQEISLKVVDEQGTSLGTVTVECQDNILNALTDRFGDEYDFYTWLKSDEEVNADLVAIQKYDGWTIVAHKAETPVVTMHEVSFEDCLSSTKDPIIVSVEDGELIDPSSIPSEPVCDGWTFEGWYTLENGKYSTEKFDFDTPITADVDLYAKWTENSDDQGEENPVVPDEDTENGNQNTTNVSGITNNDASDEATTDEASELPQTGDSTLLFAAGAAALAGAAAVAGATAIRKRNSSK